MIINGWVYTGMSFLLFITLAAVTVHYFRPKGQEERDHDEEPKFRMLSDDDE